MGILEHLRNKLKFNEFSKKCQNNRDKLGVCFRDETEEGHDLHPCGMEKCKHLQWLKIKEKSNAES